MTSRIFKLHYWPLFSCTWFIVSFIATYLISVLGGNVHPVFPYISDTGATPPESCIFGQLVNIGAVMMAVTYYIRYRQVELAIIYDDELVLSKRWNTVAFWTGNIMCLGMSVVANFQESTILIVHFMGAYMAFGIGTIFFIVQTKITYAFRKINYKYPKYGVTRSMILIRTILVLLITIFLISVSVCGLIALDQFDGSTMVWWTHEHQGYEERLASTFSEWLMCICGGIFIVTFGTEFKSIEFEEIGFRKRLLPSK